MSPELEKLLKRVQSRVDRLDDIGPHSASAMIEAIGSLSAEVEAFASFKKHFDELVTQKGNILICWDHQDGFFARRLERSWNDGMLIADKDKKQASIIDAIEDAIKADRKEYQRIFKDARKGLLTSAEWEASKLKDTVKELKARAEAAEKNVDNLTVAHGEVSLKLHAGNPAYACRALRDGKTWAEVVIQEIDRLQTAEAEDARLLARAEAAEASRDRWEHAANNYEKDVETWTKKATDADARIKVLEQEAADSTEDWALCGIPHDSVLTKLLVAQDANRKLVSENARLAEEVLKLRLFLAGPVSRLIGYAQSVDHVSEKLTNEWAQGLLDAANHVSVGVELEMAKAASVPATDRKPHEIIKDKIKLGERLTDEERYVISEFVANGGSSPKKVGAKSRVVILINPMVPVEHGIKGRKYAEASIGFSAPMESVDDRQGLASSLREIVEILESCEKPEAEACP